MTRQLDDGKAFNDPSAWGYCDWCAFMVAVDDDGVMVEHRLIRNGHDDWLCAGSGENSNANVPSVAAPAARVDLKKDRSRHRQRAYWQRQRFYARARAREKAEGLPPSRITVTSTATGEQVDLTPHVTSLATAYNDITYHEDDEDVVEYDETD